MPFFLVHPPSLRIDDDDSSTASAQVGSKTKGMRAGYGARVVECKQSERQATADKLVAEVGGFFVHPSNDPNVSQS